MNSDLITNFQQWIASISLWGISYWLCMVIPVISILAFVYARFSAPLRNIIFETTRTMSSLGNFFVVAINTLISMMKFTGIAVATIVVLLITLFLVSQIPGIISWVRLPATSAPLLSAPTANVQMTPIPVASPRLSTNPITRTTTKDVNIRYSANAEINNILLTVRNGTRLSLTGNSVMVNGKEWVEVRLDDGRIGWVNGTFLE